MDQNVENPNNPNPTIMREERPYFGYFASVGILCALAIALSIIGLASYSLLIAALTVIVLAIAFLLEGSSMVRIFRWNKERKETAMETFELNAEVLAGAAGLVLGLLALINIMPIVLISIAAIVFGTALIFGSAITPHFEETRETRIRGPVAFEIIIGAAGLVLGILAILRINPLVLSLVALMVLSFGAFMTENTLKNKVSRLYAHR